MSASTSDLQDVAQDLVGRALEVGARAADTVVAESDLLDVGVRLGEVEKVSRARERRLGLRVFVGDATAIVSSADLTPAGLDDLAREACALARTTAPDPHAGLPDPAALATAIPDLDLYDPAVESLETPDALARARDAEAAARAVSPEITNSNGAEFSSGSTRIAYASSLGFVGSYRRSSFSLSTVPVATRDGQMQRDAWWSARRHLGTLETPEEVGREAARRALRRLGARRAPTGTYPVVFDPDVAASLVGHLAGAVGGPALYRRSSWLLDRMDQRIAPETVSIVDDPLQLRGIGSRPFDGEGVRSRSTVVVEAGILRSYLLDSYSARRLGLTTTGNAARAVGDAPTVGSTNLFLTAGCHTPEDIIRSVGSGLYVTELIGFGVNGVTGDYSRGASGLWIEDGELAYPVEEITIAGNLRDMFQQIERVGVDLRFRSAIAAPTIQIAAMTVAGG